MAAKTPYSGDSYLTIADRVLPTNTASGAAPGAAFIEEAGTALRVYRFDDVATGSTWESGIKNIIHLATQRIGSETFADARLTTTATGLITFTTSSGTPDFFLYVWSLG